MNIAILGAAWIALTTTAGAQQIARPGQIRTLQHDHQVVYPAGGPVDEGPLRYEVPPVDWSQLQPSPAPLHDHDNTGASNGTPSLAVSYDARTGVETRIPLKNEQLLREVWTKGRQTGASDDERNYQQPSWTSDLAMITSKLFPWSAQCRVVYTDVGTGRTHVASGTLIDAQNVITAGHVVHAGQGGTWHSNISVYPAWDGDSDAFGESHAYVYGTFSGWTDNSDLDDDMGFIKLDRPLGFLTDWLGYGYTTDDTFYRDTYFNLAGYPNRCYAGAPDQLYYGYGLYDRVKPGVLWADAGGWACNPGNGLDGASVYAVISSERFVHAVHAQYCEKCSYDLVHTRMTGPKYNFYEGTFMPDGYSQVDRDYVPLDVNLGDEVIVAGDSLSSMDYLVGNRSLFDPAFETVTVNVYLSTNDNISTFDTLIQTHTFTADFGDRTSERIVVTTPPTIPSDTPAGQYWVGIILEVPDSNTSNNDTDGWDAAPITVEGCQVNFTPFGQGLAGSGGYVPVLYGTGNACQAGGHTIGIANALGGTYGNLWVGFNNADIYPFYGGHFYIDFASPWITILLGLQGPPGVPGAGWVNLPGGDVAALRGVTLYLQMSLADAGAIRGVSLTNGMEMTIGQ